MELLLLAAIHFALPSDGNGKKQSVRRSPPCPINRESW
jgi:hypothetical protein